MKVYAILQYGKVLKLFDSEAKADKFLQENEFKILDMRYEEYEIE